MIETSTSDDDFDGVFESFTGFAKGNVEWWETDITNDGIRNYRMEFEHGVINRVLFTDISTGKIVKVQHFEQNKLISSEIDTNGDGVFDTKKVYDEIEEVSEEWKISQ